MSTCSSRPGWTIALLDKIGSAEADVPRQIFLGTLVQSVVAAASLGGFLEGLLIIVNVGTAVALFPVLERRTNRSPSAMSALGSSNAPSSPSASSASSRPPPSSSGSCRSAST